MTLPQIVIYSPNIPTKNMSAPVFFKLKYNDKYVVYFGGGFVCLQTEDPGFSTYSSFYIAPTLCKSIVCSQFLNPDNTSVYTNPALSSTNTPPVMELQAAPGCGSMFYITAGSGQYVQAPALLPTNPPPASNACTSPGPLPGATPVAFEMVSWTPSFKLQYPNNGSFLSFDGTNFSPSSTAAPAAVFEYLNGQVIISGSLTSAGVMTTLTSPGGGPATVTTTTGLLPTTGGWNVYSNSLSTGGSYIIGPTSTGPLTIGPAGPFNALINLQVVPYALPDSTKYVVYQLPLQAKQTWANAGAYDFQTCPIQKKRKFFKTWMWAVLGGVIGLALIFGLGYLLWWDPRKRARRKQKQLDRENNLHGSDPLLSKKK